MLFLVAPFYGMYHRMQIYKKRNRFQVILQGIEGKRLSFCYFLHPILVMENRFQSFLGFLF